MRPISYELTKRGYLGLKYVNGKLDKSGLINFQIDNDLPSGFLDNETLKNLGLSELIE